MSRLEFRIGHSSTVNPAVYACEACKARNLVLYPHHRGVTTNPADRVPPGSSLIKSHRIRTTSRLRYVSVAGDLWRMPTACTDPCTVLWPLVSSYDGISDHYSMHGAPTLLQCGGYQVHEYQLTLAQYQASQRGELYLDSVVGAHVDLQSHWRHYAANGEYVLCAVEFCTSRNFLDVSRTNVRRQLRDTMLATEALGGEEALLALLQNHPDPYESNHGFVSNAAVVLGVWDA